MEKKKEIESSIEEMVEIMKEGHVGGQGKRTDTTTTTAEGVEGREGKGDDKKGEDGNKLFVEIKGLPHQQVPQPPDFSTEELEQM
ncbi:hypothetical protein IFM89_033174 [Coptis chinensis]|uniref:Uncharacterized protein n=1 Tax=Coptis chinensis TaxID=261450 RepID=A0A835IH52_9MAGN|nr:hypothetical protein IFM89_033174 [Coptis chinensis]